MSYQRIATYKTGPIAVSVTIDGQQIDITRAEVAQLNTKEKVRNVLTTKAGKQLPDDLFIHINRDKSVGLAIGHEPAVWPEDDGGN